MWSSTVRVETFSVTAHGEDITIIARVIEVLDTGKSTSDNRLLPYMTLDG